MRITVVLRPAGGRVVLPVNYQYFLTSLIYRFIKSSSEDYARFLHDEGYRISESKKGFKLFTYSMLRGERVSIVGDSIIFGRGGISWEISSPVSDFIRYLVTGVFSEGQELRIGPEGNQSRLLIDRVETMQRPQFRDKMTFLCLSPVTVSKVVGSPTLEKGGEGERVRVRGEIDELRCHYLRPWEEGFAEAIKKNLVKKYKLITGKDIEDPEFEVKIATDYMNKKAGKIIKKINFKGTNIVGFMAPFEVTGRPELIEIGYEAGFGEKGSMGFGMVKEIA